jgi:NADH-quinone oxidoreductase subunit J
VIYQMSMFGGLPAMQKALEIAQASMPRRRRGMTVAVSPFYLFAVITAVRRASWSCWPQPGAFGAVADPGLPVAAGLFVLLGAEFVAMLLIIVYVGAVAVLFLFVVMMLDVDFAELKGEMARYMPLGLLIGVVLLMQLGIGFGLDHGRRTAEAARGAGRPTRSRTPARWGCCFMTSTSCCSSWRV